MAPISEIQLSQVLDLYRIGQSVTNHSPADVQQKLLEHIVAALGADYGSIALVGDNGDLTLVAGIGKPAEFIGQTTAAGTSVMGWVAQQGQPVLLVGDLSKDARFGHLARRAGPDDNRSSLCWPLQVEGRSVGVLSLNREPDTAPFHDDDLARGELIIGIVSLVVQNVRLHAEQQQRIAALDTANTEMKRLRDTAVAARQRLQNLMQDIDAVLWEADIGSRQFSFLGNKAVTLFGYPLDAWRAGYIFWLEHVHPDDRDAVNAALATAVSDGRETQLEYRFVAADQRVLWLRDTLHVARDSQGMPRQLRGLMTDITALKTTEAALRKEKADQQALIQRLQDAQNQLLQSEKMASIGQLAAGVAHEINNPVGYVNSNLGTLKAYLGDLFALIDMYEQNEGAMGANPGILAAILAQKQRIDLGYLREDTGNLVRESIEGVTRVRKIVQDLKEFSHVDEAEWQWADLHQGLDSTLNIAHNELKYKTEVVKEYGDLPPVECIPSHLNQVFMNLLVNAGQAIETRGTITLRTGVDGDQVFVEIADTGKGMTPEVMNRIFEPFYTTKPVGKGTGLGLSLSYSIVRKHHGDIRVDSTPGVGTRFRVTVPVKQHQTVNDEQPKVAQS